MQKNETVSKEPVKIFSEGLYNESRGNESKKIRMCLRGNHMDVYINGIDLFLNDFLLKLPGFYFDCKLIPSFKK